MRNHQEDSYFCFIKQKDSVIFYTDTQEGPYKRQSHIQLSHEAQFMICIEANLMFSVQTHVLQ